MRHTGLNGDITMGALVDTFVMYMYYTYYMYYIRCGKKFVAFFPLDVIYTFFRFIMYYYYCIFI